MSTKIGKAQPREGAPGAEQYKTELPKPEISAERMAGRTVEQEPVAAKRGRPANKVLTPTPEAPSSNLREVASAELHSPIRMIGKVESNLSRFPGIKMFWVRGEGLLIKVNNAHGASIESIIPAGSVKIATFA